MPTRNGSRGHRPVGFAPSGSGSSAPVHMDFAGLNPRWRPVPEAELGRMPWAALCAIQVVQDGALQSAGTGWLAGPRTVITAAHVIAGATRGNKGLRFRVTFPSGDAVIEALDAHMHDNYVGDTNLLFDAFDIAALRIPPVERTALAIAGGLEADTQVEVAGFPASADGKLVTHQGNAHRLDPQVVLHKADTREGHSGAPVLLADADGRHAVAALHIHGFLANPNDEQFPRHNVALALREDLVAFIRAHLQSP